MAQYEQWAGFKGRNWTHSVDVRSLSRITTLHMKEMTLSWKDQLKQPTNCGEDFRSFRKKNVQKVAFLIWKQM